jgi:hypothetical protein
MIDKKNIMDAYLFLREHNHSIPSEVLEFMKEASLDKLNNPTKKLNDLQDVLEDVNPDVVVGAFQGKAENTVIDKFEMVSVDTDGVMISSDNDSACRVRLEAGKNYSILVMEVTKQSE